MKMKLGFIAFVALLAQGNGMKHGRGGHHHIIVPPNDRRRTTSRRNPGEGSKKTSRRETQEVQGGSGVINDAMYTTRRMKLPLSAGTTGTSAGRGIPAVVAQQLDATTAGDREQHERNRERERELFDTTKSSWDGWKFIKPNIDPEICFAGTSIERCSTSYSSNGGNTSTSKVLWTHDEKGCIYSKLDNEKSPKLCLTATLFSTLVETTCNENGSDAQVWTRTPNGQLKNKATNQVITKADCYAQETELILLDEWDVPEDGCDLWVVVGPDAEDFHYNDVMNRDIGSAFFTQIGQDISPGNKSRDNLFASSVSIDDDGRTIAVGGSIEVGSGDEYLAIVNVYERSDDTNSLILKAMYQFDGHVLDRVPKVTVAMSGNSKRVAIAVPSANEIRILDYDVSSSTLTELNSPIDANSKGEMPGLKLSMDKDGSTIVVGSPYYQNGSSKEESGRVRIFHYNAEQNQYVLKHELVGQNSDDRTGSDVSISDDGTFVAYGQVGHDTDVGRRNAGSAGLLKFNTVRDTWESFGGSLIHGEEKDDESGFSVKVVHMHIVQKIRLAVGAIYNNGNNQINAGHVRVFECDVTNDCESWTQIGNDIDGDNGVVIDGMTYHVGDSFGFSLDMCENGDRLVVGAPFYSELRASDYYSGNVKLFEFNTVKNDWEQIGHDLVGDGIGETSGYSVGMSKDGRTFVVGSPGEPKGSAQVYVQAEVSSNPTASPTGKPTIPPPTASPTASPTKAPTKAPTASPTKAPTKAPTKTPTSEPTTPPTGVPTKAPTKKPTIEPTTSPSATASNVPTQGPTMTASPTRTATLAPTKGATSPPTATDDVALSRTVWIGIIVGAVLTLLGCSFAAAAYKKKKKDKEEDEFGVEVGDNLEKLEEYAA